MRKGIILLIFVVAVFAISERAAAIYAWPENGKNENTDDEENLPDCRNLENQPTVANPVNAYIAIDESTNINLQNHDPHDDNSLITYARRYHVAQLILNYLYVRGEMNDKLDYAAVYRFPYDGDPLGYIDINSAYIPNLLPVNRQAIINLPSELVYDNDRAPDDLEKTLTALLQEVKNNDGDEERRSVIFLITDGSSLDEGEGEDTLIETVKNLKEIWIKQLDQISVDIFILLLDFDHNRSELSHDRIKHVWEEFFFSDAGINGDISSIAIDHQKARSDALQALIEDVFTLRPLQNADWTVESYQQEGDEGEEIYVNTWNESYAGINLFIIPANMNEEIIVNEDQISLDRVGVTHPSLRNGSNKLTVKRQNDPHDYYTAIFVEKEEINSYIQTSPDTPIAGHNVIIYPIISPDDNLNSTYSGKVIAGENEHTLEFDNDYANKRDYALLSGSTIAKPGDYEISIFAENMKEPIINCNLRVSDIPTLNISEPQLQNDEWIVNLSISNTHLIVEPFALDIELLDSTGEKIEFNGFKQPSLDDLQADVIWLNTLFIPGEPNDEQHLFVHLIAATIEDTLVISEEKEVSLFKFIPEPTVTPPPIDDHCKGCKVDPPVPYCFPVAEQEHNLFILMLVANVIAYISILIAYSQGGSFNPAIWLLGIGVLNVAIVSIFASVIILSSETLSDIFQILTTFFSLLTVIFAVFGGKKLIENLKQKQSQKLKPDTEMKNYPDLITLNWTSISSLSMATFFWIFSIVLWFIFDYCDFERIVVELLGLISS